MIDFSKLTKPQQRVLGCIAINQDGCHPEKTLAKLESLGLIVGRDERRPAGPFTMTIRRWSVPIPVHIAWCEWCSKHVDESQEESA